MNPFFALSDEQQERQLADYLIYLNRRDGVPDLTARRLPEREKFFERIRANPVRWKGEIDRKGFHENLDRRPRTPLEPKLAWLSTVAKINRAEQFAVEHAQSGPHIEAVRAKYPAVPFVEFEEMVHTRLLREACAVFDLPLELKKPPAAQQLVFRAIVRLPPAASGMLVLASEVVGVATFQLLCERCDLFSDEPDVEAHLRQLCLEILVDEAGHVVFNRALLGPKRLRISRALVGKIASSYTRDIPELAMVSGGKDRFLERVAEVASRGFELPASLAFAEETAAC